MFPAQKSATALKSLLLHRRRLTLAVGESVTAGHLQAGITAVPGASEFFVGGITAYSLEQKVRHLGVNRLRARRVNCVSAAVAEEMARGTCHLFDTELGVATTGYAEPAPTAGVDQPFAWWAIAHRKRGRFTLRHGRIDCPGARRIEVQAIVAAATLAELVSFIRELRGRAAGNSTGP